MKTVLLTLAALVISATASADTCKSSLQASVGEFKSILAHAAPKCVDSTNKTYSNDLAKKLAIAAACPKEVGALKKATEKKRAACTANCPAGASVCDTKIGLQTFYDRVNAL